MLSLFLYGHCSTSFKLDSFKARSFSSPIVIRNRSSSSFFRITPERPLSSGLLSKPNNFTTLPTEKRGFDASIELPLIVFSDNFLLVGCFCSDLFGFDFFDFGLYILCSMCARLCVSASVF